MYIFVWSVFVFIKQVSRLKHACEVVPRANMLAHILVCSTLTTDQSCDFSM